MERELLALSVEIASIAASNRQLAKPIKIPRPGRTKRNARARYQQDGSAHTDPYKQGIAVLAATSRGVRKS